MAGFIPAIHVFAIKEGVDASELGLVRVQQI
jgi:hypothetical protein